MVIKLIMVNQTLAVTVERYIAVCRPHQHLGLVTVLISSCFVIIVFCYCNLFCYHFVLLLLLLPYADKDLHIHIGKAKEG